MKAQFALCLAAILVPAAVFAQADQIIKQRAKELRDQNNVRQGVTPSTVPPAAHPAPAVAAPPTAQQQALSRFQSALAAITAGSQVTVAQKQALSRDLLGAAQGVPRPLPATVDKLVAELTAAFSEKPLSATSRARFVQEVDAVLNPAKYPQAKMDAIYADIQAIFQENGLARNKAVEIADTLKAAAAGH
jgi:hypothetical protein